MFKQQGCAMLFGVRGELAAMRPHFGFISQQ
jgi:hypothetical protein